VLTEAEEQLISTLIRSLDQNDKTSRTLTNAVLQIVAKQNAQGEAIDILTRAVERHARAQEAASASHQELTAELARWLPALKTTVDAQGQKLDAHGKRLDEIDTADKARDASTEAVAREARDAAREVTGAVKMLAPIDRDKSGTHSIVAAARGFLAEFRQMKPVEKAMVLVAVMAMVALWILAGKK
jgi:chromosome segregation ATPase